VAAAELSPGEGLARGRAERLLACSRRLEARDKALELLVRRPHSVQELRLKLSRRRFASAEVDHALAWLDERGYLDDFRFAREWAEQRLARHPEGRLALTAGLRRRGVSREVAEEVIAGICSPESEREAAEAALSKLMPRGGAAELDAGEPHSCLSAGEIERLRRALQRRGFAAALILELLPRRPGRPE